jgi:hypothetical protein
MIIVAGGDSFVWGSELKDSPHGGPNGYSRNTFTALLARDDEYVCTAYPGYNNYEIAENIRNTVREIVEHPFIVVCWTWPSRDRYYTSVTAIQDFQQYCEYRNFPYLFTCADNCLLEWLSDDTDWDNWFLFPPAEESWNTQEPRGFYQWAVENKYPVGPDGHPLEAAHQDAALLIKDKFNEMVKKHLEQNGSGNQISQETQRT